MTGKQKTAAEAGALQRAAQKQQRLEAALRANIARRKLQASERSRAKPKDEKPTDESDFAR